MSRQTFNRAVWGLIAILALLAAIEAIAGPTDRPDVLGPEDLFHLVTE